MTAAPATDCWNRIGATGDRSCPELPGHVHCRNCPVYAAGGRALLDREPPPGFREEWAGQLAAPPPEETADRAGTAAVFRVGAGEWLALPAAVFRTVTAVRPVTPLPHWSDQIRRGMVAINGELLLCFSFEALLGLPPASDQVMASARTPPRMCVIAGPRGLWVFEVAEMAGLLPWRQRDLRPAPVTVARATPHFTRALLTVEGRTAGLLDDELLFHALEREAAGGMTRSGGGAA
jgi:chemotaxis-related protein WspD